MAPYILGFLFIIFIIFAVFSVLWALRGDVHGQTIPASDRPLPSELKIFTTSEGHQIAYKEMGKGKTLLFIHGIGASHVIWRKLTPLLKNHFHVIIIDLIGFGWSSKPLEFNYGLDNQVKTLNEFCESLKLEKINLIGSSMGASVGLWFCKLYPRRISNFIGINPAVDGKLIRLPVSWLGGLSLGKTLTRKTMELIIHAVIARRENIDDELISLYFEPFRRDANATKTFFASTRLLGDKRLPDHLADVKTPVLILHGTKDRILPRRSVEKLKNTLPNVEIYFHPWAGHHIMEEDPQWVAEKFFTFFRK